MSNSVVLQCQNLCKRYDDGELSVDVLRDVNLTVSEGDMLAVMGASGSGKSTLLHCLGGLDKLSSGNVLVDGVDIHAMSEAQKSRWRNQKLGFVYQFHHLLPEFNALENVMMPLLIRGTSSSQSKRDALALIEAVGLTDRVKHRVNELSGGERQRIAIARALVTRPKCVLADEPTGNLDQTTAAQITELLLELNATQGTAFVIVTHNPEMANQLQRTLVLGQQALSG